MEYAASCAYLNGGEKTVSGLHMIEIDGRTIDPGQRNSPPVRTTVTPRR